MSYPDHELKTPRNEVLDVVRGLGILLVVAGHSPVILQETELSRVVYSFHMPLFFFLAGIFLDVEKALPDFVLSKADALLKPHFLVLGLFGMVKVLAGFAEWQSYLHGVFFGGVNTIQLGAMWFLPHLFASVVFGWMMIKIVCIGNRLSGISLMLVSFAMLFWGVFYLDYFWMKNSKGLPFSIDMVLVTSAYVIAGFALRERIGRSGLHLPASMVALVCFVGLHYFFDETMDLSLRRYGVFAVSSLQSTLGIFIMLQFSVICCSIGLLRRILAYLGRCTLFVLMFHGYLQTRIFGALSGMVRDDDVCGASHSLPASRCPSWHSKP